MLQACKAADDLKANLEEEYVAVREFIVEFCRCMDFVQHAKMLVAGCAHQHLTHAPCAYACDVTMS